MKSSRINRVDSTLDFHWAFLWGEALGPAIFSLDIWIREGAIFSTSCHLGRGADFGMSFHHELSAAQQLMHLCRQRWPRCWLSASWWKVEVLDGYKWRYLDGYKVRLWVEVEVVDWKIWMDVRFEDMDGCEVWRYGWMEVVVVEWMELEDSWSSTQPVNYTMLGRVAENSSICMGWPLGERDWPMTILTHFFLLQSGKMTPKITT